MAEQQAVIVKQDNGPVYFVCFPVTDYDYLKMKAALEGITLPQQIPGTDALNHVPPVVTQ